MKSLDGLNDEQRRAVTTAVHYISIVAGPGTGKTKTLTARIAYLLQHGTRPEEIVALTFTNKAAREIRERLAALIGAPPGKVRITTFHGLCYELLQHRNGEDLQIIPEPDRLAVVRQIKKDASLKDMTARELLARISWVKSLPLGQTPDPVVASLLHKYNEALQRINMVDFDDLLQQAHQQLQESDEQNIQHLLVDEFQDTSQLQYDILQQLKPANLFVIGDPLQSIYGFRGASGEVFERFKRDFPQAEHITLTTNYRSAPAVVHVANAIFAKAPQLQPNRDDAGIAQAVEVLNEYSEAEWIIGRIEQAIGGTDFLRSHQTAQHQARHCTFRDFAVLYRTHRMAATLQRSIAESGLPYQVVGEGSPYEQPFIKTIIEHMRMRPNKRALPPSKLAHHIIETFQLGANQPARVRDLNQFMSSLVRFDERGLDAYLQHLDQIAEQDFYDPQANAVTLLTIHAAKGLEFDHVFLLGCEDGLLPHHRLGAQTDLEEEKRLFYVAATRARTNLDVLHARKRAGQPARPSPFITDLAPAILPRILDPNLADQLKRAKKRHQKRSQTSLF
jgi:superfamily I DNA/RNA helicase